MPDILQTKTKYWFMREQTRDKDRLNHILEAINLVSDFINNVSFEDFVNDKMRYYAMVKNIEIVGEAAYKLSNEFKESHKETPWKVIAGMRHYIVHDCFRVDDNVVWDVVTNDLPQLKKQLEEYISEFK